MLYTVYFHLRSTVLAGRKLSIRYGSLADAEACQYFLWKRSNPDGCFVCRASLVSDLGSAGSHVLCSHHQWSNLDVLLDSFHVPLHRGSIWSCGLQRVRSFLLKCTRGVGIGDHNHQDWISLLFCSSWETNRFKGRSLFGKLFHYFTSVLPTFTS